MSTHWDIYCRDCGVGAGFSVNHDEAQLRELLSVRCDLSDIEMRLSGDERGGMSGWPKFASNHSGHDVIDVTDRPHKVVLECYCCQAKAEVEEGPGFVRYPINWTKDANGNDRCPKHDFEQPKFVTLGDLIEAKRRGA